METECVLKTCLKNKQIRNDSFVEDDDGIYCVTLLRLEMAKVDCLN